MKPILLSFLGIGYYRPTIYQFEGRLASESIFIAHALSEIFEPQKLLIVRTQKAFEKFFEGKGLNDGEYLITDSLSDLHPPVELCPVPVPDGKSPEELWQMFQAITEAVPEGCELILDVTHGFRSQPMLALAACTYLQVVKKVQVKHIFYGAYDAKNEEGIAPIFDLMPFMELIRMAQGFEFYLQRGDAVPLATMMKKLTIEGVDMRSIGQIRNLGKTLEMMSAAKSLIRTQEALQQADKFTRMADQPIHVHSPMAAPFIDLINLANDKNREVAKANGNPFTSEGLSAQADMISTYLLSGQYQQAVTLAREAMVSKVCLTHELDPITERATAEDILNTIAEPTNLQSGEYPMILSGKEYSRETAKLWSNLREIRNDLNHAAMRQGPTKSGKLASIIPASCEEVIQFLRKPLD